MKQERWKESEKKGRRTKTREEKESEDAGVRKGEKLRNPVFPMSCAAEIGK
jgi:hypothetical protein